MLENRSDVWLKSLCHFDTLEEWRRWTGIEPAGQGSPIPPALKAGEPTRRSDTSAEDDIGAERRRPIR